MKENLANKLVLAIFADPDDESLIAGENLKAYSEKGLTTILISLSPGDRGFIAHPDLANPENLVLS